MAEEGQKKNQTINQLQAQIDSLELQQESLQKHWDDFDQETCRGSFDSLRKFTEEFGVKLSTIEASAESELTTKIDEAAELYAQTKSK